MRIIRNFRNLHNHFTNPVLTLGNFDGVHLGHQAIFEKVVTRARKIKGTGIAFTFEPHPLKVIAPERSPRLLNTFHGKMRLLEKAGIEIAICAHFTRAFAEQNSEDFARMILHESIGVREVYVGYDYAFGKGREGSIDSLKRMGQEFGFDVGVIDAVRVQGTVVSSSVIRDHLLSGAVSEAAKLLGRDYTIEGEVVHGAQRGKTLGFPTANIKTPNELIPGAGVYAVYVFLEGRQYHGVTSIGIRPTFDAGPVSIEAHLLDFKGDIYGKQLEMAFVKRLRGEEKFPNVEALIQQIRKDVQNAEFILRER
jgi:riboflavin kinase / FMN adenylyltransferase